MVLENIESDILVTCLEQRMSIVPLADPELQLRHRQVPVWCTELQQPPIYRMTVNEQLHLGATH